MLSLFYLWVCFFTSGTFSAIMYIFCFFPPLFSFLGEAGGRSRATCLLLYKLPHQPHLFSVFPLELPGVFHSHSVFHANSHIVQIIHALSLHCCILGKRSTISGLLHLKCKSQLTTLYPSKIYIFGECTPIGK